jgi:hypothetical protein
MTHAGLRIDNVPVYLLCYRISRTNVTHSEGARQRIVFNTVLKLYKERKRRGSDILDDGTASIDDLIRRHLVEDKGYNRAAKMHLQAQQALAKRDFSKAVYNYARAFCMSGLKRQYLVRLLICKLILAWGLVLDRH